MTKSCSAGVLSKEAHIVALPVHARRVQYSQTTFQNMDDFLTQGYSCSFGYCGVLAQMVFCPVTYIEPCAFSRETFPNNYGIGGSGRSCSAGKYEKVTY